MSRTETAYYFAGGAFRAVIALRGYRSLAHFAREAGISEALINQISRGLIPSSETRVKIAGILQVVEAAIWKPIASPSVTLEDLRARAAK
jgi:hypothetical protein